MRVRTALIASAIAMTIHSGCSPDFTEQKPWTFDQLMVEVVDTSREISYTNKRAGFYYTESNGYHRTSWQGWHVSSAKLIDDFRIDVDGRFLDRSTVDYARVWPHRFTRSYHEGVQETFTLLDSLDGFVVTLEQVRSGTAGLSILADRSVDISDTESFVRDGLLLFSPFTPSFRKSRPDVPGWIALCPVGDGATVRDTLIVNNDETLLGTARVTVADARASFIVVSASTPDGASVLARAVRDNRSALLRSRRDRIERLLNESIVRTSDERFDKALAWATISMDALLMDQGGKGIFAGLPWFSNYWGRDTFISLPGATLVRGKYAEAKEILSSFARWQNTDPKSIDEGRIPNIVTPTSRAYNTADGTPWFVIGLFDYVRYSGDTAFARAQYPVLRRAIEGPLRHRTDKNLFLTHGDAESWMDAAGPDGPWSPRGNRGVDIQSLWHRQLVVSTTIAESLGELKDAERWSAAADHVMASFREMFVNAERGQLADHLNPDGSPDESVRPNQLFALRMIPEDSIRSRVFRNVTQHLVYEYGVGSLTPHDSNFHPYHHHSPYYVQDAAYHNGIVWTWLNGVWIQAAVDFGEPDLAWRLTSSMVRQLLDRGAVGTMSELLDAAPRPGEAEPRLSGTFSQAWSLAEFIRTVHQSYFGVSVDAIARQVWLMPRLPTALNGASFDVYVGNDRLRVAYTGDYRSGTIRLEAADLSSPLSVSMGWPFGNGRGRTCALNLQSGQALEIILTEEAASVRSADGSEVQSSSQKQLIATFPVLRDLKLTQPLVRPDLRTLMGPEYPLLSHPTIKRRLTDANVLVDETDPEGDDVGPGTFTYPQTSHLKHGSLDLTGFRVAFEDSVVGFELTFRTLSNPGWHPEYGFQLTYAAIAIDRDGLAGSGQQAVGGNSGYRLHGSGGYEAVVYVGGGVRVEDSKGQVLAAYLPTQGDETDPLGDARTGKISFALPVSVLGTPSRDWKYIVLVGAQDDHGGAGIGEFRSVERIGGEWVGGGRMSRTDSNVYDVLVSGR